MLQSLIPNACLNGQFPFWQWFKDFRDHLETSGDPIKFFKVKWQLTYKKTYATPIYSSSDLPEEEKSLKLSWICLTTFFSIYLHTFRKTYW